MPVRLAVQENGMLYKFVKKFFVKACNRSFIGVVIDRVHYFVERHVLGSFWKCELALRGVRPFSSFNSMIIIGQPVVSMSIGSAIDIGDKVLFVSKSRFCLSASLYESCKIHTIYSSARIVIGDEVSFNGTSVVCRSSSINIGARTMIGPNVTIFDSPFHPIWPIDMRNCYPGKELDEPVEIAEDVWIGANVTILAGAKIGSGSVIGAGSLVRGVIPSNSFAAGSPARVIRRLDIEDNI